MRTLAITILLACFTLTAQSQLCGEGVFTFEFYVLNGQQPSDIRYELLPVNMDSLKRISSSWRRDFNDGIMINPIYAGSITDSAGTTELERQLAFQGNKKEGKVINGIIQFKTTEVAYYPCLLKLSSNKKELYIVVDVIGGCDRTTTILWNDNPKIVR